MEKRRKRASLIPEFVLLVTFPLWFFGGIILFFIVMGRPTEYAFGQSKEQIKAVEIVEITGGGVSTSRICEVEPEEWSVFWKGMEQVECRKYVNDPPTNFGKVGVRITYKDDSYEILTDEICGYAGADRNFYVDFNWYYFDQEQFYSFLSKYAEDYPFLSGK